MRVLQVNVDDVSFPGLSQMICRVLRKKPEDLEIDVAIVKPIRNEAFIERLEKNGAVVHDIRANIAHGTGLFQCRKNLLSLLEEENYDIVHIHGENAWEMRLFSSAAKKAGIPKIILHAHSTEHSQKKSWPKLILHQAVCRTLVMYGTDFVVSTVDAGKRMFPNIEEEDLIGIREGISTAAFHFDPAVRERIREEFDIPDSSIVIGNVSSFDRQNNHEFMMDVLAELMTKKPETMMLLVGDGPRLKEIRQEAAAYGLSKNIIFSRKGKINEYMQAMDAFIYPTRSKTFPSVVVKAQTAGLPTFVSEQVPEEAKIIDTFESLPIEKESELIWAERIRKRRVTPKKRMQGASKVKKAGFGIARTVKAYLALYQLLEEEPENEEE